MYSHYKSRKTPNHTLQVILIIQNVCLGVKGEDSRHIICLYW